MVDIINRQYNTKVTVAKLFQFPEISLLAEFLKKENETRPDKMEIGIKEDIEKIIRILKMH